jgi:hypothetical protein
VWSFDIYIGIRYRDKVSSEVGKGGGGGEDVKKKKEETNGIKRKIKYLNISWPMPLFLIFILLHKLVSIRVSEVSRKNKKGGVIIPDDNIT